MYLFFPDYICRQKIRGDSQGMPHSQFGRQRVFPLYSYLLFETDISSPYTWHFVTGHFVIRTFHHKDILSHGHLVTRTFCHTDISSHNLLVSLQITKKKQKFSNPPNSYEPLPLSTIHRFFCKNSFYKNTQAENRQIFKKVLRIIVRLILYFPYETYVLGGFHGKVPLLAVNW